MGCVADGNYFSCFSDCHFTFRETVVACSSTTAFFSTWFWARSCKNTRSKVLRQKAWNTVRMGLRCHGCFRCFHMPVSSCCCISAHTKWPLALKTTDKFAKWLWDRYTVSTSSAGYGAWLTGRSELNRKQHTLPVLSADTETKGILSSWEKALTNWLFTVTCW